MTKTLESRLDTALQHIEISAAMIRQGIDTQTPVDRLEWTAARVQEALDLARKIEKRDRRKELTAA